MCRGEHELERRRLTWLELGLGFGLGSGLGLGLGFGFGLEWRRLARQPAHTHGQVR